MIPLWNMYTTGLSSRMAEMIRPFASCGVLGMTIFMPGMCAKVPHRHCECWAASEYPPPTAVVTTIGTVTLPPDS